jgi:hypothetical protein
MKKLNVQMIWKRYWFAVLASIVLFSQHMAASCYKNIQNQCGVAVNCRNYAVVCDWFPPHIQNCSGTSPGGYYASTTTTASGYWTTSSAQGICSAWVTPCATCCSGLTGWSSEVWVTVSAAQFLGCPASNNN